MGVKKDKVGKWLAAGVPLRHLGRLDAALAELSEIKIWSHHPYQSRPIVYSSEDFDAFFDSVGNRCDAQKRLAQLLGINPQRLRALRAAGGVSDVWASEHQLKMKLEQVRREYGR